MKRLKLVLVIIVFSQFCCTSLWFAGNGVMNDLVRNFGLTELALGHLTSAVQFGFISGTLLFAILTIADRFSPSKVFFVSALFGALFNALIILNSNSMESLLLFRFLTGFFLAGIYPVGMKIAADYFEKDLGKSLGYLVGALVVGTAFPHLLKGMTHGLPWKWVLSGTSTLAIFGGILILILVPNGPYRKRGIGLNFSAFFRVFRNSDFRGAAFGYFGHMWELYTFWAFVPIILIIYNQSHPQASIDVSIFSFLIIAIGGPACVLGGYISQSLGIKKTAFISLFLSCSCCLISPLILSINLPYVVLVFLLFWGMVVIADSPLFSTLVAQNADSNTRGTALTIVNCIGFSITIISIQLINGMREIIDPKNIFICLAIGPILGLFALWQRPNLE